MTTREFAQFVIEEVSRLQPISHVQVQTLSDFIHWYTNPSIKFSPNVAKSHLEHLGKLTKSFLVTQLEITQPVNEEQKQDCYYLDRAVDILLDLRIELALARSKYYLKILRPIYDFSANPNVIWDVYLVCSANQDLSDSYLKGTEIWAKRAFAKLEMKLKQDNMILLPEQRKDAQERFLVDTRRIQ